ncbi:hypothetical protein PGT21_003782 [Puccinia graminis f. sp. tritici]|uniref:Uncharacterized protein n=1 Tax=Puccinia graminis f. sp. tritici TaxID=56615 RepID=A0A5B0N2Z0_PUCGR|nr:hypothetical protein PGT21_003782 [Puccinia graminis f. sp. tritici]KAA1133657.1 hypothetical protein PGTUg99_029892 [Puccinia graminis f. sp. tritici]
MAQSLKILTVAIVLSLMLVGQSAALDFASLAKRGTQEECPSQLKARGLVDSKPPLERRAPPQCRSAGFFDRVC